MGRGIVERGDAMSVADAFMAAVRGRTLLFDGGLGTALIAKGLDLAVEPPEAWLLTQPARLGEVHRAFYMAGADVLQTGSFGLGRLLRAGQIPGVLSAQDRPHASHADQALHQAQRLARRSVQQAMSAGVPPAFVVAALGPSGPPPSAAEVAAIADQTEALAQTFLAAGACALHIETACDPMDLAALLAGAGRTALPLAVSLTVSLGQSGLETPLGVPLARMLKAIGEADVRPVIIGVNCSQPARRLRRAVSELAEWAAGQRGERPRVLAQPEVDEPAPDCKRPPPPETPERFAADLVQLLSEGADHLGGCCGCRPEHIAAVATRLAADRH